MRSSAGGGVMIRQVYVMLYCNIVLAASVQFLTNSLTISV